MNILGQLQQAINQFNADPGNFSIVTAEFPDTAESSEAPPVLARLTSTAKPSDGVDLLRFGQARSEETDAGDATL